ncbi:hypothetical protein UAY_03030 [Enterococcus moraviensis ATCC BAA-383]|uniref:Glycosyltransferase RgtA/B/C/D-like domain-containing protein n=1 Tax=Enterococcus moraviensis ATCC BAA-383 TaxID=1158609 RepID=R2SLV3_9ENTE|nr:hypothetical protein [Enterococcus moraviensis]EOH96120.1 hypothetical protein UAY_03030 [Enterococcus moraviensis ATCC BAA-383]EOT66092.1 hypothetical protein I586_02363 [Enterococcus moraviensis ATCC BAA-383]
MTIILYGLLLFFLLVGGYVIQKESGKALFGKHNRFNQVLFIILCVGLLVRYFNIGELPGLQIDEAMSGYDTWALANYGTDSALNSWPIYLIGYGTGPNALYSYLSLPFVKIMGLNLISTRLAMLSLSSITLLVVMWTLLKLKIPRYLSLAIFFVLTISPWHIMISRFGLDANVAPHLLLLAFCFIQLGIEALGKRKMIFYSFSVFLLGLTAYAYIATWYFLPIFLVLILIYFMKNHLIDTKQMILLMAILVVTILPILLFAFIQYFGEESISIFGITFPKLIGSQNTGQTILFQEDFLSALVENLKRIVVFIIYGGDGLIFSSIPGFGFIYNLAGVFLVGIGLRKINQENTHFSKITLLWFWSCIPLILIVVPVVHHWNVILFPMTIIMGYGLYALYSFEKVEVFQSSVSVLTILFVLFLFNYTSKYKEEQQDSTYMAPTTLGDVLTVGNEKKLETIYVDRSSFKQLKNWTFIFFRFYDPISPEAYQATRDTPYDRLENMTIKHYGRYVFLEDGEKIEDTEGSVGYLGHSGTDLDELEELKDFETYENKDFVLLYKE